MVTSFGPVLAVSLEARAGAHWLAIQGPGPQPVGELTHAGPAVEIQSSALRL